MVGQEGDAVWPIDVLPLEVTELRGPAAGPAQREEKPAEVGRGVPQDGAKLLIRHRPPRRALGVVDAAEGVLADQAHLLGRPVETALDVGVDPVPGPRALPLGMRLNPVFKVQGQAVADAPRAQLPGEQGQGPRAVLKRLRAQAAGLGVGQVEVNDLGDGPPVARLGRATQELDQVGEALEELVERPQLVQGVGRVAVTGRRAGRSGGRDRGPGGHHHDRLGVNGAARPRDVGGLPFGSHGVCSFRGRTVKRPPERPAAPLPRPCSSDRSTAGRPGSG